MTTREWARQFRQKQDAEWESSGANSRAIQSQRDSVWQELVQELVSGLEGYGDPRFGHYKTAPGNHVWWVKLLVDTPNKDMEKREVKLVNDLAANEIHITYSGMETENFSIRIGILETGDVGLRLADHDVTIPDIAQKILKPFLS